MEVPEDIREKATKRYRYKDDLEAQACVAAASEAWRKAFALYRPKFDPDKLVLASNPTQELSDEAQAIERKQG